MNKRYLYPKYILLTLSSIVSMIGFFNLGFLNIITIVGSTTFLLVFASPNKPLKLNFQKIKFLLFIEILGALFYIMLKDGNSLSYTYFYLILTTATIPLMSSYLKDKKQLILFFIISFTLEVLFSINFLEKDSYYIIFAFLITSYAGFILNDRRIALENKNYEKKSQLNSILRSLPEVLVSYEDNSFSILSKNDTKFLTENFKKFILDNFINNYTEIDFDIRYEEDNKIYNIKKINNEKFKDLFYITDLTHKLSQEKELENNRHQLVNSSKLASLGEMAGGVAHEINNPLQIISLSVEQMRLLLTEKTINVPEIGKICDEVESTIDRINNIVKGMKLISRDGNEDPFEKINLKSIVLETLGFCKEKFKNNGVKLILFDEVHDNYDVYAQRVMLSQVILNLLNNAFDAILKNNTKVIRIHLAKNNDNIVLSIFDNGPGVPEHLVEKIFQPFFTTKEIGKGTGLGLSISKSIIEKHSGKISLDKDNHSKFIIELPLFNEGKAS